MAIKEESPMRKAALKPFLATAAAVAVLAGASLMFLQSRHAAAEAGGLYINAVDLVVIPSEMPKFLEAIKENGANAVKEPGCREFNITVLANNPNHVFLYEVYDNAAALDAHRQTEHFKKFAAATKDMIADRSVRAMSVIAMNAKAQ
jgi:(4S)-4-hydroxy-5-phosphonooxypentane-2,3-dione isomerase